VRADRGCGLVLGYTPLVRIRPGSEWDSETFEQEDLSSADLRGCVFADCDFVDCTLTGVDMSRSVLDGCHFRGGDMSTCKVTDAKFRGICFTGTRLRGVLWTDVYQLGLELSFVDSNLSYSSFFGLHLRDFKATGCTLHEVDFGEAVLKSADFTKSDLAGAIFHRATLESVDFGSARNLALDVRTAKMKKIKLSLEGAIAALDVLGVEVVLE